MLNPETGWINQSLRCDGGGRSTQLAERSDVGLSCVGHSGYLGRRQRYSDLLGVAARCAQDGDASKIDGAGARDVPQRHVADDFAGFFYNLTLTVVGLSILYRPAGAQSGHRCAGRLHHVLQSLPVQELFYVSKHGLRRHAGLAALSGYFG